MGKGRGTPSHPPDWVSIEAELEDLSVKVLEAAEKAHPGINDRINELVSKLEARDSPSWFPTGKAEA
jgi:hypothetical protein